MGIKGVISSHATLYSRTELERATQIAARSTAPISWETPPMPLVDQFVKEVAEGRFTNLFTLFSIKLHQEIVWDADGN